MSPSLQERSEDILLKALASYLGLQGNQGQLKESLAPLASVCVCLLPSGSNPLALHGHGNHQESV